MIKTFFQASQVHKTYNANAFIYYLRKFPIIGRFIKNHEYGGGLVKVIANISYYIRSIGAFCLADWIYLAIVFSMSKALESQNGTPVEAIFPLILLGLLPIGILLNNSIFSAEQDKYYDIVIFKMDARKLVLSTLYYRLIRMVIGYTSAFLVICHLSDISWLTAALLILAVVLGKFIGINIRTRCTMTQKDTLFIGFSTIILALSVITATALILTQVIVPTIVFQVIFGIIAIAGIINAPFVIGFKNYRQLCKYTLGVDKVFVSQNNNSNMLKDAAVNNITFEDETLDVTKTSNKSGFAYFNHIFVIRHKKLLAKKTTILCIASAVIWGIIMGFCLFNRLTGEPTITNITSAYKGLLLIPLFMYYINQGDGLVQAMFYNCDNAMLTYNFYRKPENILGVFKERIKTIIRYNLIIAGVLSLEIISLAPVATNCNWGTLVLLAIILIFATSILFSVHKLVMYYLIQPFTDGVAAQKPSWGIINIVTYMVCFSLAQLMDEINPMLALYIAIGFIVFAILYFVIAMVLVKRLAPSRFKLNR